MVEPWPSTDTPDGVVRVARAILKSRFYDCEPQAYASMSEFWQSIYRNDHWIEAEWEARAVIEALMEPTPEMVKSGIGTSEVDAVDWVGALFGTGVGSYEQIMVSSFQAMLRTALSQPNEEGEGK